MSDNFHKSREIKAEHHKVKRKKNIMGTTSETATSEGKDGQEASLTGDADGKRKKQNRNNTSPETSTCDHDDAPQVTKKSDMDLKEVDIKDQPLRKELNDEKRSVHKKTEDKAIMDNIDLSGELKAADNVVLSDSATAGVSKEMEGKIDPPADTDAKRRNKKRIRMRKKNSSAQNNTIENKIQENHLVSDQEDSFTSETITHGIQGGKIAIPGKTVCVQYTGWLKDGTVFFDETDYPAVFRLGIGEVINGWDVGIDGMCVGEVRHLTIPPSMGFGATKIGKVPPNSTLLFEVTLLDVYD